MQWLVRRHAPAASARDQRTAGLTTGGRFEFSGIGRKYETHSHV
jgi:hypothetical protein